VNARAGSLICQFEIARWNISLVSRATLDDNVLTARRRIGADYP
jgi:hypothetical protein